MVSTYVHDSVCINAYKYTCMEEEEKEALSLLTNDSFCLRSESVRGLEGENQQEGLRGQDMAMGVIETHFRHKCMKL